MKKFFFMAAAMFAAVSMNAQFIHVGNASLNADGTTDLAAGSALGSVAGAGAVTTAFADAWKNVNVKTDSYAFFFAGETALNTDTMGVQGNTNGKDEGGNNPATTLLPFASGAALKYVAEADGYLTVFHKGSSNKQYVVFEEGTAIAYEYAQLVKLEDVIQVVSYALEGDEEGYVTAPILKVGEIVKNETLAASTFSGESAMRFPVYAGSNYIFGATGSKMSLLGVYFSAAKEEISVSKAEGADKLVLLTAGEPQAIENNAEAVKATKAIENGQLVIIKNGVRYNAVGAQL